MATPFLVIFMLFDDSIVTRVTAPVFLRWVFEVSLTNCALQAIVMTRCSMESGAKGCEVIICGKLRAQSRRSAR